MRVLPLLLALSACPPPRELPEIEPPEWPESDAFSFDAALFGRVAGSAVDDDELVVGFGGQTALLRPETVEVETVVEAAPGIDEIVMAVGRETRGIVALVRTPLDVRLVVFEGEGIKAPWTVSGVVDADLVGEAPVVLYRSETECLVRWVEDDVEVGLGLQCVETSNLTAIDADTVVVALGKSGIVRVTADGVVQLAEAGRSVDYDGVDRLYAATADESAIVVMDVDGVVENTIPAGGQVTHLAGLAGRGVVWSEVVEAGWALRWASPGGEMLGEVVHNEAIDALSASTDGLRVGVQRTLDVGTYQVGR